MNRRSHRNVGESAVEGSSYIPVFEEEGEGEDEVDSCDISSRHELETHTATGSVMAVLGKYISEDHESSGSDNENDESTPELVGIRYLDDWTKAEVEIELELRGSDPLICVFLTQRRSRRRNSIWMMYE